MPKLTYGDVFLPEKEDVMTKINEMMQQTNALTFALVKHMVDNNLKSVTVNRKEFINQMHQAGIEEPIQLAFQGNGEAFTITLG